MRDLAIADCHDKMAKAIEHLKDEFSAVRTGRASSSLVEKLLVDYYGSPTPLLQLAGFGTPEPRVLVITPYDKSSIKAIEKAIQSSDLGITPNNDGTLIRLVFPQLTEERRKELVKIVKQRSEDAKVAVRNVRRHVRTELESLEKDGDLSRDELDRVEKELEAYTHKVVAEIDELLHHKEQELLEV
jgi:ribosome recycling factor